MKRPLNLGGGGVWNFFQGVGTFSGGRGVEATIWGRGKPPNPPVNPSMMQGELRRQLYSIIVAVSAQILS